MGWQYRTLTEQMAEITGVGLFELLPAAPYTRTGRKTKETGLRIHLR